MHQAVRLGMLRHRPGWLFLGPDAADELSPFHAHGGRFASMARGQCYVRKDWKDGVGVGTLLGPPGPPERFRFQCIISCEIFPAVGPGDKGSYEIRVLSSDMPRLDLNIADEGQPAQIIHPPDEGFAFAAAQERADDYCAMTNKTPKITGGDGFNMGPGLDIVFVCLSPEKGR
jgi:hypothetical protein